MTHPRAIRARIADGLTALPSGFVGSPATYRSLIAALVLGPVVRRPYRQGPSEQQLVNAADDVAYADSGAPDYEYTTLEVEDWVTSGAEVGTPIVRDATGNGADGVVTGLPGDRATLTGFTATDEVDGLELDGMRTVMVAIDSIALTATAMILCGSTGNSNRGYYFYSASSSGGQLIFAQAHDAGLTGTTKILGASSLPSSLRVFLHLPDGGNIGLHAYDVAGVVQGSSTGAATEALAVAADGHAIGSRRGSLLLGTQVAVPEVLAWSGTLTPAQMSDVAAGTDLHSPDRHYSGLRSGVLDPSDTSILVIGDDAGLSVLAP